MAEAEDTNRRWEKRDSPPFPSNKCHLWTVSLLFPEFLSNTRGNRTWESHVLFLRGRPEQQQYDWSELWRVDRPASRVLEHLSPNSGDQQCSAAQNGLLRQIAHERFQDVIDGVYEEQDDGGHPNKWLFNV